MDLHIGYCSAVGLGCTFLFLLLDESQLSTVIVKKCHSTKGRHLQQKNRVKVASDLKHSCCTFPWSAHFHDKGKQDCQCRNQMAAPAYPGKQVSASAHLQSSGSNLRGLCTKRELSPFFPEKKVVSTVCPVIRRKVSSMIPRVHGFSDSTALPYHGQVSRTTLTCIPRG